MMIISTTTIIAGAVVVLLAVLGSLINPFLRSLRFQKTGTAENQPPVSILITAHDNLAELERNLPMFLRQQYAADYQVIVVCQSTDGETQDFLKRTAAENPHLYYTYIPESSRYMSRKKLQITLGVKAAKHEWIILTEPNCRPSNDKWLQTMVRQCQDPNHLVLGYVALDEETKSVRRFDSIRKAYYVLRRAQQTYGYRSHMPNVAFRKSDFMKEQGYQGNLEYVRGEYDFLVNKYAHCGDTATELDCDAWLIREAPSSKSWHNAHLYLQASRKSLERAGSMRTLMFFDHLMPHLSLIATLAVAAYSILTENWILTGCAGFSFLLLFIVRMLIANKAIRHFDDGIAMFKLPFFEYGIIWRNLATKLRYWRADKNDFTSHKL
ncbi:glycosyltransferase family 2 protein [Segatella copri]|uniref:glycosyltransferase family 2 protein n=1 Tax=Segatella copri TaxID=165179 RepID=UPI001C491DCE|nr:glycosyltransferase [Segatella copri]MBW0045875.1 glycosyltransferase [Segatella copri]